MQTDNLAKQLDVQNANIALLKANALKTASETDWRNLNTTRLKENIMPYDFDFYSMRSRQMAQNINNATVQNEVLSNTVKKIQSDTNLNSTRKAMMTAQMQHLEKQDFWNAMSKSQQIRASNVMMKLAETSDKLKAKEINKIEADQVFRQSELMLKSIGMGVNGLSFLKSLFIN